MSLDDLLVATVRPRKGPPCTIATLYDTMPADKAAVLRELLARHHSQTPGTTIARTVQAEGYHVSHETVQRHRRGDCACPKADAS